MLLNVNTHANSVIENLLALMKLIEVLMNLYLPYSFSCCRKWMYILRKWTAEGVFRLVRLPPTSSVGTTCHQPFELVRLANNQMDLYNLPTTSWIGTTCQQQVGLVRLANNQLDLYDFPAASWIDTTCQQLVGLVRLPTRWIGGTCCLSVALLWFGKPRLSALTCQLRDGVVGFECSTDHLQIEVVWFANHQVW